MLTALVVSAALAGGAWGLLVPGLVSRYAVDWPEGEPAPPWRTTCAHCGVDRPSWWRASGRCPGCRRRPVPGWWVTVPLSAAVFAAAGAGIGLTPALPAFLLLAAVAVPLALTDLLVLRLPDPLVGAALLGGLLLFAVAAGVGSSWPALGRACVAAAVCGAGYLVLLLMPRSQFGLGDVKLGAVLGLHLGWIGWHAVGAGVLLAPLVNLPVLLGFLIARRAGLRTAVPYGPAMLAAAFLAMIITGRP